MIEVLISAIPFSNFVIEREAPISKWWQSEAAVCEKANIYYIAFIFIAFIFIAFTLIILIIFLICIRTSKTHPNFWQRKKCATKSPKNLEFSAWPENFRSKGRYAPNPPSRWSQALYRSPQTSLTGSYWSMLLYFDHFEDKPLAHQFKSKKCMHWLCKCAMTQ